MAPDHPERRGKREPITHFSSKPYTPLRNRDFLRGKKGVGERSDLETEKEGKSDGGEDAGGDDKRLGVHWPSTAVEQGGGTNAGPPAQARPPPGGRRGRKPYPMG
ncbi:hypothetical protein B296_00039160 [Ensete ventricosum]|uniref:Uncharacterized protein n=1 Tax=Ensete ventricosum TaxID=4639 RepID=A0A426X605_ENSVE|nr:hypothetical protein B296_00039160 [Ensete ventricosum]